MRKIRDAKYAGLYSAAGRVYILNAIAFTGAASIIVFIIAYIGKLIYQGIAGLSG